MQIDGIEFVDRFDSACIAFELVNKEDIHTH